MRRLISATLLLYPRAVRRGHGAELESLVQELIERDGASRPRVMTRLALDGLTQRMTTRATAMVVGATLLVTSFGGLAVSDFAAASARDAVPAHRAHPAHVQVIAAPERSAPARDVRLHHVRRRSAGIIR